MEKVWRYLSKLNTEIPYDPAIPLLGVYLDKTFLEKDTCTRMFIAALFTIAKTWKQPKCPSTDGWIRKVWYIYTMEYYSAIKKNKIMPLAATWTELEILILSEVRKRKTNNIGFHLYLKSNTQHKRTFLKRKKLMDLENRLVVAKGEGEGVGMLWTRNLVLTEANYCLWNG